MTSFDEMRTKTPLREQRGVSVISLSHPIAKRGGMSIRNVTAKPAVFKSLRNADAATRGNDHDRHIQSSAQPPRAYLQLGWPLFPVNRRTRAPLIKDGGGFYGATADEATIADWLQRWPRALLATPTGRSYRHIAVDVDIKHPPINGFDALAEVGWAILPNTLMVHSPSGGLHLHLDPGEREIPTTQGTIGAGIDVRGEISSIILPTPGNGYRWDPHWNFGTVGLAPAPDRLVPPAPERKASAEVPARYEDAYAAAALAKACWRIRNAPAGQQEATLNSQCFWIGTLAGADGIPADIALSWLLKAAHDMQSSDVGAGPQTQSPCGCEQGRRRKRARHSATRPPKQPLNPEKREAAPRGLEPPGGLLTRVFRGNTLDVRYAMRPTRSTRCCCA
jgi:bifunctional DNA primase/polymerase-like protein